MAKQTSKFTYLDEALGEPDLNDLVTRLTPLIGEKWIEIAIFLNIDRVKQLEIESSFRNGGRFCQYLREVLHAWRNNQDEAKPYKWSTILCALEDPLLGAKSVATVLYADLANKISPPHSLRHPSDETEEALYSGESQDDEQKSNASGTGSEDTTTFLCGCGECSIDTFIKNGCRNAGKSQKFPLLDASSLPPEKQMHLISRLTEEANDIAEEFAFLASQIAISFEKNTNVELLELKVYLSSIETVKARAQMLTNATAEESLLFNPIVDKITEAKNMSALFSLMANFWSWFNYYLLEKLVKRYGKENETKLFEVYFNKLEDYLKRRVYEVPSSIHNPNSLHSFTRFYVKMSEDIRNTKATDLITICRTFGRILEISPEALILTTVQDGCVELEFLVPKCFEKLFPLSETAHNELLRLEWKIYSITCGEAEAEHFHMMNNDSAVTYTNKLIMPPKVVTLKGKKIDEESIGSDESSGIGTSITAGSASPTKQSGSDSEISSGYHDGQASRFQHSTNSHRDYWNLGGIFNICQECLVVAPNESLIATPCLNPDLHDGKYPMVCAGWDAQEKMLVQIRPLPWMANFTRGFALCNKDERCRKEKCTFAHSIVEKIAWNWEINKMKRHAAKKHQQNHQFIQQPFPTLFTERPVYSTSGIPFQTLPTLPPQLTSANDFNHHGMQCRQWQQVSSAHQSFTASLPLQLPKAFGLQSPRHLSHHESKQQIIRFVVNRNENYAEFNKWKLKFTERLQRTKLEDAALEAKLTVDNYQDKFYNLLCFEEMEHINILTSRCDGTCEFEFLSESDVKKLHCLPYEKLENVGILKGMTSNQIGYATQSSEGLFFVQYSEHGTDYEEVCKASILSCNFSFSNAEKYFYVSLRKHDADKLAKAFGAGGSSGSHICHIEFEVKHGFFDTLHKAVVNIPPFIIRKIMPKYDQISDISKLKIISSQHLSNDGAVPKLFDVADGAQLSALNSIRTMSHQVPVLISGPFGSGKTRILARAAYELIKRSVEESTSTRILICAHHSGSIQTYINDYFGKLEENEISEAKIVRITRGTFQKDSKLNSFFLNLHDFREAVFNGQYLNEKCLVIITTYMTSIQLLSIIKEPGWHFTHVFLDEAGQVREPEAIAPLCLAGKETKIVIAGDTKQVGPALLVLGEPASSNGLELSLLERLEKTYEEISKDHHANPYNVLNGNYRCNFQLAEFLSKLFYSENIGCKKVQIPLHPNSKKSPLVFYCCDIERLARAPQEASFEAEADVIISQLRFFYNDRLKNDTAKVCAIASTRTQVNIMRQKLEGYYKKVNVLPTFMMQGHEFDSVFLSTSEPLEDDGHSQDPQKSLCNPYVFNTALSRARSLVVAVGNPFMLLKIEERMGSKYRCWREYLRYCLRKDQVFFSKKYDWRKTTEIKSSIWKAIEDDDSNSSPFLHEQIFHKSEVVIQGSISDSPSRQPLPPQPLPQTQDQQAHDPAIKSYADIVKSSQGNNPKTTKKPGLHVDEYERISDVDSDTEDDSNKAGKDDLIERFLENLHS